MIPRQHSTVTSVAHKASFADAYINETTVMAVNVHEPETAPPGSAQQPLDVNRDASRDGLYKLKVGEKKEGVDGEWYYVGSSLHFAKKRLPPPLPKGSSVELVRCALLTITMVQVPAPPRLITPPFFA